MTARTYVELVGTLFPRLTGGIRWGLERTERMLATVGDPHRSFRSIHVGGTNGKGSVAATLESVLRTAGHRTGLYTSPHLCTFRERIRIGDAAVSEQQLLAAADRLWPAFEAEKPSFFEATTAIAFLVLAEAGIDVAVIEVGLGGRLDATNVVRPEVSVVTNVALDHVQFLGPTLASVAGEKAGIFKAGVPAITAETEAEPLEVLRAEAVARGASLSVLEERDVELVSATPAGTRFRLHDTPWQDRDLWTPLIGPHQATNTALAVRALELLPPDLRPTPDAVERGVGSVRWPGRLQIERTRGRTWIFDVAHNVAGVQALARSLETLDLPGPRVLLVGVLGDKDWRNMLRPLYAVADGAVLTLPPTAPAERAWNPESVLAEVPSPEAQAVRDFAAAMDLAVSRSGPGGTVIVTGSFHTVGDALAALGLAPDGVDPALPLSPVAA